MLAGLALDWCALLMNLILEFQLVLQLVEPTRPCAAAVVHWTCYFILLFRLYSGFCGFTLCALRPVSVIAVLGQTETFARGQPICVGPSSDILLYTLLYLRRAWVILLVATRAVGLRRLFVLPNEPSQLNLQHLIVCLDRLFTYWFLVLCEDGDHLFVELA